jgi:ParB family transcriptional regulator, chromosome partitioning protein
VSAKRSLGRGLDALLPKVEKERAVQEVPLSKLSVSALQPRKRFDPESVAELTRSVAQKGVLQPLLVRPSGDGYEIVAGERRFRAAQQAGLSTVPVVVKVLGDRETLEIALIENVQREDLSALEEARAFRQLLEFGLSQEEVAEAVGKSRSAVANTLRLLQLDEAALTVLEAGEITAGHARAILAQPETDRAWALERILEGHLSVRQAEGLKRAVKAEPPATREAKADTLRDLELNLSRAVGTKVRVSGDRKGKIELHFGSRDELERLLELLNYSA